MDELEALTHRLERERRARQEAEKLLEVKSRALYMAVEESDRLADELRQTVGFQTQELLNAQRVARVGTLIWDINAELITWSEGVYSILGLDRAHPVWLGQNREATGAVRLGLVGRDCP